MATSHSDPFPLPRSGRGARVLVVDGHRLVAESVARMLPQLDAVRTATSVTSVPAARDVLRRRGADLVLVDERVDGEPGLDLVETARGDAPTPVVVVFSASTTPERVARALRDGAAGWVTKDSTADELAEALAVVLSGRHWVTRQLRSEVIDELLADAGVAPTSPNGIRLSKRQGEVLGCLVEGLTHVETADRLRLSLNTVRTHVRNMCRLAGVHSTPALVAMARMGRLSTPVHAGNSPK